MSIKISKEIRLEVKVPNSAYFRRNAMSIGSRPRKLGNVIGATNSILGKEEFLKEILPSIIGLSAKAPEWQTRVNLYFNNFTKVIPTSGIKLEIGLEYDTKAKSESYNKVKDELEEWYNSEREEYLQRKELNKLHELNKEYTFRLFDIATDCYKYGKPLNKEDYLIYSYCLVSSQVANREEEKGKSQNILFYLVEPEMRRKKQVVAFNLQNKADKLFLDTIGDTNKIEAVLSIFGENIYMLHDLEEKQMKLKSYATKEPVRFIDIVTDKQLMDKSFIEQCITNGILKRYSNSTVIVDNDNNTIGENIDAVIAYMNDSTKVAFRNNLEVKLKMLKK